MKLAGNAHDRRSGNGAAEPSLLAGLLCDESGNGLSPSHAVKNGKRYRYYVSRSLITGVGTRRNAQGFRIPAHEIETLVTNMLERLLLSGTRLFDLLELDRCSPNQARRTLAQAKRAAGNLRKWSGSDAAAALLGLIDRVVVGGEEVQVVVSVSGVRDVLGLDPSVRTDGTLDSDLAGYGITVPARLKRCGGASKLIVIDDHIECVKEPDPALTRILRRAHAWSTRLATGKAQSAAVIARDEELTRSYVTRVVRLAFLAPDIVEAILDGRQPPDLSAERLVRRSRLPLAWDEQRRRLGAGQR